jgi:hypothetical protein
MDRYDPTAVNAPPITRVIIKNTKYFEMKLI